MSEDWREGLPEEVRGWQEVEQAENPEAFWGQMSDLRSAIGRSLTVPTEEASPEQWAEFYGKVAERANGRLVHVPTAEEGEDAQAAFRAALGIPQDADGFTIPTGDELPPVGEERSAMLRGLAVKHGLTPAQFEGLATDLLAADGATLAAQTQQQQEAQAALKAEWGDAYEQEYSKLGKLLELTGGPPELVSAVQNKQLGPETAKWLTAVGKALGGEKANLVQQAGGASPKDTVEEAKQKLDEIYAQDGRNGQPAHPFFDTSHERHAEALRQVVALTKAANPGASDNVNDLRAGGFTMASGA